jgi:FKBP-type peptidyl-prolyl cis-trans isomerase
MHFLYSFPGMLASNGSKFDLRSDLGKPFKFNIGQGMGIKGWEEG